MKTEKYFENPDEDVLPEASLIPLSAINPAMFLSRDEKQQGHNGVGWDLLTRDGSLDLKAPFDLEIVSFSLDRSKNSILVMKAQDPKTTGRIVYIHTPYTASTISKLQPGTRFSQGDVITQMGRQGHATGIHLHLEAWTYTSSGAFLKKINPGKLFKRT